MESAVHVGIGECRHVFILMTVGGRVEKSLLIYKFPDSMYSWNRVLEIIIQYRPSY